MYRHECGILKFSFRRRVLSQRAGPTFLLSVSSPSKRRLRPRASKFYRVEFSSRERAVI